MVILSAVFTVLTRMKGLHPIKRLSWAGRALAVLRPPLGKACPIGAFLRDPDGLLADLCGEQSPERRAFGDAFERIRSAKAAAIATKPVDCIPDTDMAHFEPRVIFVPEHRPYLARAPH